MDLGAWAVEHASERRAARLRFFARRSMKRTAKELAEAIHATLEGDGNLEIIGVAAPERAASRELIYVDSAKYAERAAASAALCVISAGCWIGENCRIHPRVTLYHHVRIGHRVEIHSGAVIGADGFGYAFGEGKHWKFPQAGIVEIGDDVEIGANTTIDRGSLDDTRIAEGVKLDNLVHVGHNCQVGAHTVVAAEVGFSGSCIGGKTVVSAGQ